MTIPSDSADPLDVVAALLRKASHVAVLTGAGISAESGIPTFRDALTGLWSRFDAEDLATPEAFQRDPALVWGWYEWRRMKVLQAEPNPAHRALARLAEQLPQLTLITQNVDDLHERAGSRDVLHLHGSLHQPRCFDCGVTWTCPPGVPHEPEGGRHVEPPLCAACSGRIRPGVVWFGENLPLDILNAAEQAVRDCDLLLAVGTSGLVYPAANLPVMARRHGKAVVIVNPNPSGQDGVATHLLRGPAGTVLPGLLAKINGGKNATI